MTETFHKTLLSPLLSGRETEFKVNLFLDSRLKTNINENPFKRVVYENGLFCYEAELECGDGFLNKKILLGLVGENPENLTFYQQITRLIKNKQLPKQLLMSFGDEYPLTLFPQLYCRHKDIFMMIPSIDRGKSYGDLLQSIKTSKNEDDYYCVTCSENKACYESQQNAEQYLSIFNSHPVGLFALEYYAINLLEASQLCACTDSEEHTLYQNNLAENQSVTDLHRRSLAFNGCKEKHVASTVVKKLKLFQLVINYIKSQLQQNIDVISIFQFNNIYLSEIDAAFDECQVSLLPIFTDRLDENQHSEQESIDATARIIEENNQCQIEFRKSLSDKRSINIGDKLILDLVEFDGGNSNITCQVVEVENDFYLMQIQVIDADLLTEILTCYQQDIFKPVTYFPAETEKLFSDQLFFCFANVLLKNSVLGEEELRHAQNLLVRSLNTTGETPDINDIAEIVNANSALAVVLRQENIFYQPSTEVTHKLSRLHWFSIIVWMFQTAYYFDNGRVKQSQDQLIAHIEQKSNDLSVLIHEIADSHAQKSEHLQDEEFIIRKSVSELVSDEIWLNAVLALGKPILGSKPNDVNEVIDDSHLQNNIVSPLEKTKIDTKQEDDRTLLMPKRNESQDR